MSLRTTLEQVAARFNEQFNAAVQFLIEGTDIEAHIVPASIIVRTSPTASDTPVKEDTTQTVETPQSSQTATQRDDNATDSASDLLPAALSVAQAFNSPPPRTTSPSDEPIPEGWLPAPEAAKAYGMAYSTFMDRCITGAIPNKKIAGRRYAAPPEQS